MMSAFCDDISFARRDGLFGVKLTKIPRESVRTSPKLWMNLQATYDLDKAARAREVA